MKISDIEKSYLLEKYKKEGLTKEEITKRLKEIESFDEFCKFSNKYLTPRI